MGMVQTINEINVSDVAMHLVTPCVHDKMRKQRDWLQKYMYSSGYIVNLQGRLDEYLRVCQSFSCRKSRVKVLSVYLVITLDSPGIFHDCIISTFCHILATGSDFNHYCGNRSINSSSVRIMTR